MSCQHARVPENHVVTAAVAGGESSADEGSAREEAPHRVLLPPGLLHDGRDRRSPRAAQHRNHVGLLEIGTRPRRFGFPAFRGLASALAGLRRFADGAGGFLAGSAPNRRLRPPNLATCWQRAPERMNALLAAHPEMTKLAVGCVINNGDPI